MSASPEAQKDLCKRDRHCHLQDDYYVNRPPIQSDTTPYVPLTEVSRVVLQFASLSNAEERDRTRTSMALVPEPNPCRARA